MGESSSLKVKAGGATVVMALTWAAGTGAAFAEGSAPAGNTAARSAAGSAAAGGSPAGTPATRPASETVPPCYVQVPGSPGSGGSNPGGSSRGSSSGSGGQNAGGGWHLSPSYGNGTPASAYAAYAQLPTGAPASSAATPSSLAFTGSEPILYGIGGAALLTLGGALVGLTRRRPLPDGPDDAGS